MIVEVKEKLQKTRHVKNNDKSIFYDEREMWDFLLEFYLNNRNFIISHTFYLKVYLGKKLPKLLCPTF